MYLQEENPCSWGRKNPMSSLSRMKNPDLPYLHVAAALRAYSTSSSLDVLNSLGTTASFSSLSKARVHYVPARPCQLITVCFMFHILTIPCVLSLVDHCHIRHASPPLRPIEGVRGIHPFYHPNTKRRKRDVCVPGYLLCLGPSH